jgi:signal recognition particle GTPase
MHTSPAPQPGTATALTRALRRRPAPAPGLSPSLPCKRPQRQRAKGRPYVVVFCGVNGVGKSTNLAKIAYWLGQHGARGSTV